MATNKIKKIVFMGSSPFAESVLRDLYHFFDTVAEVVAVYSQPPKPKERGKKIEKTMVQRLAEEKPSVVRTPLRFDRTEVEFLQSMAPDLIIVVAYGLLLPADVLSLPTIMAMNIHPSLLPQHRGATPIESSLLAGDQVSGVSLIKMTTSMDAGDILAIKKMAVAADDNRATLSQKLLTLSIDLLRAELPNILAGGFTHQPQQPGDATYSQKIKTSDYQTYPLTESSVTITRKIRAYYPKAFLSLPGGKRLQLLAAKQTTGQHQQEIFYDGVRVLLPCADGVVELSTVKPENKNAMTAVDWWRGRRQ